MTFEIWLQYSRIHRKALQDAGIQDAYMSLTLSDGVFRNHAYWEGKQDLFRTETEARNEIARLKKDNYFPGLEFVLVVTVVAYDRDEVISVVIDRINT